MANIVIKELLASDKVNELVNKINFNFDQLLLNGGGPIGLKGGPGGLGPIGPRGTIWFTAIDLWTTPDSPSWTGSPTRVNNILAPGYPQFKGDPNRFQPIAPTGTTPALPWIFPENTYTLNIPIKPVRGGDLYLQEGNDTFNSYASTDGDIWEFNAISATWSFTGVNIKGNTGNSGINATGEWIRESALTDDIIYPKHVTGQDTTRVFIGAYNDVYKLDNSSAALTINTDLTHIAFNNPAIHSELVNPGDEDFGATMTMTSAGDFILLGSAVGTSKQIIVQSNDSNITIQAGGLNYLTYTQNPNASIHIYEGGAVEVYHPSLGSGLQYTKYTAPTGALSTNVLNQYFEPANNWINIFTSATGYGSPAANIASTPHIMLQNNTIKNVGIGTFTTGTIPQSKLGIKGNISVGVNYGNLISPDASGAIIEGRVGIGTSTFPANSAHILQVNGSIIIGADNNILGDNIYYDTVASAFKPIYGSVGNGRAAWFIKQNPTVTDTSAELNLFIFPVTEPGSNSGSNPASNPSNSPITFRQSKNANLGKMGLNIGGFATDSRLTINDTDGTGLHFIRFGTLTPTSDDFYGSLASGARIWHSVVAHTYAGDIDVDRRFNIYQFETSDLVIGNKTLANPTNTTHHRIVIKKETGFIGINTLRPKHILTIKGRDSIPDPELNAPTPFGGFNYDPDEVNIGTFEDRTINGLNVYSNNSFVQTNIAGASYIGFNAWFSNPNAPLNAPEVVYGKHESGNGQAGAIMFADSNGNIHFANFGEYIALGGPIPGF